jgi:histone deacetylase HOS2
MALGCGNPFDDEPVVKEWGRNAAGAEDHMGLAVWRSLSDRDQEMLIEAEALENGVEKPKGYAVSFHYNPRLEAHHFGKNHPMKPWRLTLTKQLVLSYGLHFAMDIYESRQADATDLTQYHSPDYIEFLQHIDPERNGHNPRIIDEDTRAKFLGSTEVWSDCPIFDGMYSYFTLYSGATLEAAQKLIMGQSDIAINWSGGLHHAHKKYGAGFCYINDIVLAVRQLLMIHPRVLYVDIDVHHGDGVEEAFYSTDRVLTLSYHKFAEGFFPGTGAKDHTGPKDPSNPGRHHALNVPLKDGILDDEWKALFERITGPVIDTYNPGAIVLQCGADSLGGDKLGSFNLNIKAHGHCVEFVKSKAHGRHLILVGGGGYTPRNVARCWTHETARLLGIELKDKLPSHVPCRQAFMGEERGSGLLYPKLDVGNKIHDNKNTIADLESLVEHIHEELRYIQGSPSVQLQRIPIDYLRVREEEDARMRDEDNDYERERAEISRRRKERNVGGRGEGSVS